MKPARSPRGFTDNIRNTEQNMWNHLDRGLSDQYNLKVDAERTL